MTYNINVHYYFNSNIHHPSLIDFEMLIFLFCFLWFLGFITVDELITIIKALEGNLTKEEMIRKTDIDGNGRVDFEKFLHIIEIKMKVKNSTINLHVSYDSFIAYTKYFKNQTKPTDSNGWTGNQPLHHFGWFRLYLSLKEVDWIKVELIFFYFAFF